MNPLFRIYTAGASLLPGFLFLAVFAVTGSSCGGGEEASRALLYDSLNQAVAAGDLYAVEDFLEAGQAPDFLEHGDPTSPLLIAAQHGFAEIAALLIDTSAALYARALSQGVEAPANFPANLNVADAFGNTALHLAAASNQVYALQTLATKGVYLENRNKQGYTPLHVAVEAGNVEAVEMLLDLGADVYKDADRNVHSPPIVIAAKARQWGVTALLQERGVIYSIHRAAAFGDLGVVKRMIENDPRLAEALAGTHETPLFSAVASGELEVAKYLVDLGVNLEAPTREGRTPLVAAVMGGHKDTAKLLIDSGVNLDDNSLHTAGGSSVIHVVARMGNVDMAAFLLDNGAQVDIRDPEKSTPLHASAVASQGEMAKFLIARGAQVSAPNANGLTPLHEAVNSGASTVIQVLLTSGANVNARDKQGNAPLHFAVRSNIDTLQTLLAAGADPNIADHEGRTPLHLAAELGRTGQCAGLLSGGASIDQGDSSGATPLHLAASVGNTAAVTFLIEKGASVNALNNTGRTPLFAATERGSLGMFQLLREAGADATIADARGQTLLHVAAGLKNNTLVAQLLGLGMDPMGADVLERVPLHAAAEAGGLDTIELLLDAGAGVAPSDVAGATPLHLAAQRGHRLILQRLLDLGADLEVRDALDRLPIHYAATSQKGDSIEFFLAREVAGNAADKGGNTPLHMAVMNGNQDGVIVLLQAGVNLLVRNQEGETALLAIQKHRSSPQRRSADVDAENGFRIALDERIMNLLTASVNARYAEAAAQGDEKDLEKLIEAYPDLLQMTILGLTPLHRASAAGNLQCVKLLLEHGSKVDSISAEGDGATALQLAARKGWLKVLRELAGRGADLTRTDSMGVAPMQAALAGKHLETVKWLAEQVAAAAEESNRPS